MNSRTFNIKRNLSSGIMKQVLNIVLPFIIRTIIIYYLGSEYQGISGLFSSILQMLSLADLGFSTAVVFALYKPISESNTELINALIGYLKKIYHIVGIIVLSVGLIIYPFLGKLITGHIPEDINIKIIYLIYLFNSVLSYYLFAYKSALFNAMQREDVVSNIYTVTTLIIRLIQVVLLITFRNYYVYIMIQPLGTIANNIMLQIYSKKLFPSIIPKGEIPANVKSNLTNQIKALLVSRIADVARNSLDNIVISSFIGLSAVTVYDNYLYIYTGIRGFFLVLSTSMQASVGNSLVEESIEKNYFDLKKINFVMSITAGFCSVCLYCLYQPFMFIWMKGDKDLMLSFSGMALFCFYFYSININNVINVYINGNGYYWQLRWWYIFEAVANLGLNIVLGYFYGINGIIIATIITLFIFNFLPRVKVVFKEYFKRSPKEFFALQFKYFFITVVISIIVGFISSFIRIEGILGFLVKAILVASVSLICYFIVYFRDIYFKGIIKMATSVFRKKGGQ